MICLSKQTDFFFKIQYINSFKKFIYFAKMPSSLFNFSVFAEDFLEKESR